ncbi:MAG TPA: hypothetical protein EYH22_03055 [Candidatus Nanopusillus sp.]|nr:hypothetical protein [Candidatus Nanopusillus sp.]
MLKEVIDRLISLKGRPLVFIFSSFIHGAGKSFLKNKFKEMLEKEGYSVYSISTGDIFRELAARNNMSIDAFVDYLYKNPNIAQKVDLELDKSIYETVSRLIKEKQYDVILVDSNLASYYINGKNVIKIKVVSDPDIIAKRVFENPRKSDRSYNSIEDVKISILKRTEEDKKRYARLAKEVEDPFWKKVYSNWGKDVFDIIINNNSTWEDSIKQLLDGLRKITR